MDEKTLARFWKKVDKDGPVPSHCPELGPCWMWTAYRDPNGYGRFGVGHVAALAHRVAFEIHSGTAAPRHLGVCHKCDNPGCVNHGHFFLGTMTENMADKVAKGRQARGDRAGCRLKPDSVPRGVRHHAAKLSEQQVTEILQAYKGRRKGPTQEALARHYGVTRATIADAVKGTSYRAQHDGRLRTDERQKLSDDEVRQIRLLYVGPRRGPSLRELSVRFGVTLSHVHLIVTGKSRKLPPDEPSDTDDSGAER